MDEDGTKALPKHPQTVLFDSTLLNEIEIDHVLSGGDPDSEVLDVHDLEGMDPAISSSNPRDRDLHTHRLINQTIKRKKNIRLLLKEWTTDSYLH